MQKKLNEMAYDEEGVVVKIEEDLRQKIAGVGIRTGKKIKMITKEPLKGPVVVMVDEAKTSLGLSVADKIIMEV
ncbi:MAG: ferrous iron transport protein A [Syntrophobacterales bacterium]|nr:ferrous iron transport protein A [Syntrophobacterales bacterium]